MVKARDKVRYVPKWAVGDDEHPDCENGVVIRVEAGRCWVKYPGSASPQPTDPADLIPRS